MLFMRHLSNVFVCSFQNRKEMNCAPILYVCSLDFTYRTIPQLLFVYNILSSRMYMNLLGYSSFNYYRIPAPFKFSCAYILNEHYRNMTSEDCGEYCTRREDFKRGCKSFSHEQVHKERGWANFTSRPSRAGSCVYREIPHSPYHRA